LEQKARRKAGVNRALFCRTLVNESNEQFRTLLRLE